ncbi:MAG TPA: DUF3592 domain-containing protein [Rhodocyclaceae bacterium]|nr:DUF3592 domain-containing protein [Rhodocyclaceae bacterium]
MFEEQIARIPSHPPRQVSDLPGLKWTSVASRAGLVLPVALVLLFGLMPLLMFSSEPHGRLALGHAEVVEGRVVSVSANGCRGDGRQITYAFTPPNGLEYRGTASLCSGSAYSNLEPGQAVPIKYLVADPSNNAIAGTGEQDGPPLLFFAFFPLMALLFLGPMFLPQAREVFKARRIFRKGEIVQGKVIFVKRRTSATWPGWPGSSAVEVFIGYRLPSGAAAEAKAWCNNDWLLHHLAPGAGVSIAVMAGKPGEAVLIEGFVR